MPPSISRPSVPEVDRQTLHARLVRGDDFRLVMAGSAFAFRAKHDVLHFFGSERVTIHLQRGDDKAAVEVSPRLIVSELGTLQPAVLGGLGVALLAAYQCVDDLRAKRLERVLREWQPPPTPIHLVYPSTRHVSPTVKSVIGHVQQQMTPGPGKSARCLEQR